MIILGDTHGIKPVFELIDKYGITSENIIHVGDLGLGFLPIDKDLYNLSLLNEMLQVTDNTLYAIRGNHDNPIFWDKSLGLNLPTYSHIHLVEDYSVIKIEECNILFIGGAISIDRSSRIQDKPYPTWWKNEGFNLDKTKLGEIYLNHPVIDIVVTHNCPDFCHPQFQENNLVKKWITLENQTPIHSSMNLKADILTERKRFTELYNILTQQAGYKIKKWFYGHYHYSYCEDINDTEFIMLGVNEIKELK